MINISSNEFWGLRSGAYNENFGKSTERTYFEYYFQQMQWTKAKSGNNKTKTKGKDYKNPKLDRRNKSFSLFGK